MNLGYVWEMERLLKIDFYQSEGMGAYYWFQVIKVHNLCPPWVCTILKYGKQLNQALSQPVKDLFMFCKTYKNDLLALLVCAA